MPEGGGGRRVVAWWHGAKDRIRSLLFRGREEEALREEMAFHLEMETAKLLREGMSPEEARREAYLRFGGVERMKERTRQERGTRLVETVIQDLRYAVRMLGKNVVFTAAAVLTLALGIGLNAATFSAVHAILLRPLPGVEEPERLVQLYRHFRGDFHFGSNSIPHYRDLRDRTDEAFEDVAAWTLENIGVAAGGGSERVAGLMVSANFFRTYGVRPHAGRFFRPGVEDRDPGAHPVAVISHGYWRSRFGGDPSVVGRTVRINSHPFQVVGVAPPDFNGPIGVIAPYVYVPLIMQREVVPGGDLFEARGSSFLMVVARLRPGVTMERAREATDALYGQLLEEHPGSYDPNGGITFIPQEEAGLHPQWRQASMGMGAVMMTVVALLLLLACVNVANLFLARARQRGPEMGVRLSLGAGRGRLVRQLLTESLLFGAVAGAAGLILAWGLVLVMNRIEPPIDVPWAFGVTLDGTVLLFTLGVSVAASIVFGLVPALHASKPGAIASLRSGQSRGATRSRLTRGLVVAQVGLSLLLLISAGLFLRSLQGATRIDKGFEEGNLLLASLDTSLQGYTEDESQAFWEQLLVRVRSLPGVESAAVAEEVPLGTGSQQTGITVPGYDFGENERRSIDYNIAGPAYFETMGIDLLQGRSFGDEDAERPVMVVNRNFAERFWPGESPLGRTVQTGTTEWQVVGVVENGKYASLGEEPKAFMYLNWPRTRDQSMTLHVRTAGDPASLAGPIRQEVRALDPELPVFDVRTMESHLGFALLPARLGGVVLGAFGLLGLFLAAIGIYGVMAYSVSLRRRELGIRSALGAGRSGVVRMVLREGLGLALAGTVAGLAAAAVGSRLFAGLLYGVDPLDPLAFTLVPAVLLGVAALAVYLPARRAASVDPSEALRVE